MDWGTEILIGMLDKPEYQIRRLSDPELDAALRYAEQQRDKSGTPKRGNKYNAKKVFADGIWFDSKAEAARYSDLFLLQRAGQISDLKVHHKIVFETGVSWKIDFIYTERDITVYEDVKGKLTADYRIKRDTLVWELMTGRRDGIYREVTRQKSRWHIKTYPQ